ncbi:hypothetical protein C0995_011430 [Termitomyces sp. Mi166|nr:hypothetical protein C0995_011430 [Termitomyces sp. Mi166\
MAPLVTINKHTTSSFPRPHILYTVEVTLQGTTTTVTRRYSEFITLHGELPHDTLGDPFLLPPKRLLLTSFIPLAWVDDTLISERKAGLTKYLSNLLKSAEYKDDSSLLKFLNENDACAHSQFDTEATIKPSLKLAIDRIEANTASIAAAYYVSWGASENPPERIDFSKFDILFFAFATPNASSTLSFDPGSQAILKRLATAAHNSGKGTKVVLSIGGWGGCQYFSSSVSTSANRMKLVNSVKKIVEANGLDGIDIDWEYPNSPGAGHPYSPADSANLLSFIKALRMLLGSSKIISAAVAHLPWLGSNGKPLTDVSAYAVQMNYVNIMNYDVWGASATPGPNAPLGNPCGTSKRPQANAQAALKQWTAAGFPASKLLLGLPLYGYVSKSSKTVLTGSSLSSSDTLPPAWSNDPNLPSSFQIGDVGITNDVRIEKEVDDSQVADHDLESLDDAHSQSAKLKMRTMETDLSSWWGQQIPFNAIVKSGALVKKSDGTYGQGGGFTMDTWSLGDKATFAKQNGMAGCFTWSLDQLVKSPDYKDDSTLLQFFTDVKHPTPPKFNLADVLPSTLSKKAALNLSFKASGNVAAAATPIAVWYYPDWSADDYA